MAGVGSKTANMLKLKQAQELAEQGAKRDWNVTALQKKIWDETGWFKDVDGQWKYEIDDSGASMVKAKEGGHMYPDVIGRGGRDQFSERPLWRVIDHKKAYSDYPSLEDIKTSTPVREGFGSASYSPESSRLGFDYRKITEPERINLHAKENAKSNILHEVQHAIQGREGFARGGSPLTQLDEGLNDFPKHLPIYFRIKKIRSEVDDLARQRVMATKNKLSKDQQMDLERQMKWKSEELSGLLDEFSFDRYKRLAGEAEARNVQTRVDFTPAERMAKPPWTTLDVPEDELLVRGVLGGK
jgi:hypothetical protein